jgi:hypothetical protein
MEAVASARTMEAEVQVAQALLACLLASPVRCLQASRQPRLVTRPPLQELPALASRPHHQDTWLRLHPRTTHQLRLDTARLRHRRTRLRPLQATHRPRLSTLLHHPTTAQRPQRSWVARLLRRTARHHHNTVPRRRSTVLRAPNTRQAVIGVLLLHPRRRNTARRRHVTRQPALRGPSHRPRRATARLLRVKRTLLHLQSNSWLDDVGRPVLISS